MNHEFNLHNSDNFFEDNFSLPAFAAKGDINIDSINDVNVKASNLTVDEAIQINSDNNLLILSAIDSKFFQEKLTKRVFLPLKTMITEVMMLK